MHGLLEALRGANGKLLAENFYPQGQGLMID